QRRLDRWYHLRHIWGHPLAVGHSGFGVRCAGVLCGLRHTPGWLLWAVFWHWHRGLQRLPVVLLYTGGALHGCGHHCHRPDRHLWTHRTFGLLRPSLGHVISHASIDSTANVEYEYRCAVYL